MKHIIATLAVAMAATAAVSAAKPSLRIYRDDETPDTVSRATYYVIGVTDPDATARIDGKDVHVYRTGSFGAEYTLRPGLNVIPVEVRRGRDAARTEARVYYREPVASAGAARAGEADREIAPLNIVTRPGAYLQYGNGGDRLGGSKMNFVDSGIPMTAVAETERLYKVRLGAGGFAYVQKSDVTPGGDGAGTYNTGSCSITNTGKTDRIVMSLPGRLPYYSRTEIDPNTIRVSIYGAMNNTNWLTQHNDPGIVKFVDLEQTAADVLTIVIRLNDTQNWGYSVDYSGNSLVIDVRHRPQSLALKDLTIGLDAGHGGEYPGARSPSGLLEKDINLDLVLKAADMLRAKGAKVVLTRDGDTGPSMTERKRIWREARVDLAVSVHNNASGNPLKPLGTSAYYKHISNRALADAIHRSMLGLGLANFGLTGNFNFSLNGPTDYPNALVEVLFMSSLPEAELLADPEYRTRLAAAIVKGIEDFLAAADKK